MEGDVITRTDKYSSMSKSEFKRHLDHDPWVVNFVNDLDEGLQLYAIDRFPFVYPALKRPTEAATKLAVSKVGSLIRYVYRPSEELQMLACSDDGYAIQYLESPSQAVIDIALKQNPDALTCREFLESGIRE